MRKITLLLSTLVLVSMLLTACGGQETSTSAPSTDIPTMEEPTSEATTTQEGPDGTQTVSPAGGTPGVPVTGEANPARISNQLDFNVWNQDGEQIGEVNDMVLDLDNAAVSYVIVGTGGFLDLGERDILVPWNSLQLQTEGGDMTGGEQNAFILQTDQEIFANAPDVDVNTILPALGEPASDWDLDIRNYWEGGVVPAGTPSGATTAVPGTTGTASPGTVASPQATPGTGTSATASPSVATASPGGTGATTGALQGVVLATEVLGSTITVGTSGGVVMESPSTTTGQAQGTGTPGTTAQATGTPAATPMPATTGTPSTSTGTGTQGQLVSATIEDLIVDIDTGDIQYVVVNSTFEDGERWIPVPLDLLNWDANSGAFVLNVDQAMVQAAPFFTGDEFPDTLLEGWDADFSDFWQNSGSGSGTSSTATP